MSKKKVSGEPRILIYDLETAHNIVASFSLKEEYTPHTNILQERYIICAGYRWLGSNKTHAIAVTDDPETFAKNPCDDSYVVREFYKIIETADVIVAHNGDAFDRKYFNTRILAHGLNPLPPLTSVDTYKVARQNFMLNSNSLDYLGKFLGFGRKKSTSVELWLRVLRGEADAVKEMVAYCKRDVELLEKVFNRLLPFMPNIVSRELFGLTGCARCGSKKIQWRGYHRAISRVYRRFQCQSCGGWGRAQTNEKEIKVTQRIL